jgi:hypothetical protein
MTVRSLRLLVLALSYFREGHSAPARSANPPKRQAAVVAHQRSARRRPPRRPAWESRTPQIAVIMVQRVRLRRCR